MSTDSTGKQYLAEIGVVGAPIYFSSAGHALFGWLRQPAVSAMSGVGLVICNPFGYESICARRSARAFAAAAAAIGVSSLSFDYVGTGDSQDIDPNVDQLKMWVGDVVAAVGELQRRTRVERVCLLGFRLGALLAALAAAQCKVATALIAIAPVVTGRRYLRELRTIQLAASLGGALSAGNGRQERDPASSDGPLEVAGFSLSAASVDSLSQLDLTELRAPPVLDMLVIDRSDLPSAHVWTQSMSALGARIRYLSLPGFVEMMMTTPYFTVLPEAMIAAMRDWLPLLRDNPVPKHLSRGVPYVRQRLEAASAVLAPPGNGHSRHSSVTERAMFFGSQPSLFGIVTEPVDTKARCSAVILLNDGATHHIGSSRMHVSLARCLARQGCIVLRMDLAGLGDSETRAGRPANVVFPPEALDDIGVAIEFIRSRFGVVDVTLAGLCSGAYHSLRAAVAGLPVNRIILLNPQNFFWKQGMMLDDVQLAEVVRNPSVYRKRVFSAVGWRRLLTGQVNIGRILGVYIDRTALALETMLRRAARRLHVHLPRDLGCELEELVARGIRIVFVFARGEPGLDLLRIQGGSSVGRLGERFRLHIIDGADHVFSQSSFRARLEEVLTAELLADQERLGVVTDDRVESGFRR